jgi:hypothetical protein
MCCCTLAPVLPLQGKTHNSSHVRLGFGEFHVTNALPPHHKEWNREASSTARLHMAPNGKSVLVVARFSTCKVLAWWRILDRLFIYTCISTIRMKRISARSSQRESNDRHMGRTGVKRLMKIALLWDITDNSGVTTGKEGRKKESIRELGTILLTDRCGTALYAGV